MTGMFGEKRLTIIGPGRSVDYYANFNAGGRANVDSARGAFVLISIKGQLWFTDGQDVWDAQPSRDLVIGKPVTWKIVREHATVIER